MLDTSHYFNLNYYELQDLKELVSYNKKFDGIHKVKMNVLDRFIAREHKYGYNRMMPFGIWMLCGFFIPFWILFIFIISLFTSNSDVICGIGFLICIVIGLVIQIIYSFSCDKIDYNSLMNRNTQINIFEYMESKKMKD